MSDQQTCGKGLAERSPLPAKLAELTAAMAEILAFHQKSLAPGDAELSTYKRLEEQYRAASEILRSTGQNMADARSLPMGKHDVRVLASKENADIFARFVHVERELSTLLQQMLERDQKMLDQMR